MIGFVDIFSLAPRFDVSFSKAGAEAFDQVRVEGSVVLVFDCAGLVKLDQFAGDAAGFRGFGPAKRKVAGARGIDKKR